jgi:hypothetical protein
MRAEQAGRLSVVLPGWSDEQDEQEKEMTNGMAR